VSFARRWPWLSPSGSTSNGIALIGFFGQHDNRGTWQGALELRDRLCWWGPTGTGRIRTRHSRILGRLETPAARNSELLQTVYVLRVLAEFEDNGASCVSLFNR